MKTKKVIDFLIPIFIGLLVAAVLKNYLFINIKVPTGSMEPTIMTGDRLLGSKATYIANEPTRGDIVAFYSPEDNQTVFVKRIIGLPGETVAIIGGKVYINGSDTPLSEAYINQEDEATGDFGPYTVPDKSYFVMGDNRNNSFDSRYWKTTNYVSEDSIIAKLTLKYYSSNAFCFGKID